MRVIVLSVLPVGAKHCMEPITCELLYLVLIPPTWDRCHPCFHKWGTESSEQLSDFPKRRQLVSAGVCVWPRVPCYGASFSNQSLVHAADCKLWTQGFKCSFPPHFSFSCPAPVLHIKKSGPRIDWLASYLADLCSIAHGPLGCCSFCIKSCWAHLCCHRALPAVALLGWNEEISCCRMLSGLAV